MTKKESSKVKLGYAYTGLFGSHQSCARIMMEVIFEDRRGISAHHQCFHRLWHPRKISSLMPANCPPVSHKSRQTQALLQVQFLEPQLQD